MNRVIAAAAALVTAAAATTVLATAVGPARAATQATHPAAHATHATHKTHKTHETHETVSGKHGTGPAARHLKAAPAATEIASEIEHGKYVTLVKCSGAIPPKPIRLAAKDIPLTVHGTGSSPAIIAKLAKPNRYKTLYTCTVTVRLQSPVVTVKKKKKTTTTTAKSNQCIVCSKAITLNTGFGGLAGKVATHHPAG